MNDNTIIRIKVPAHLYESVKAKLMIKEDEYTQGSFFGKKEEPKKPENPNATGVAKPAANQRFEEGELDENALLDAGLIASGMAALGLSPLVVDKFWNYVKKKNPEAYKKAQGISGAIDKSMGGNRPGQGHGAEGGHFGLEEILREAKKEDAKKVAAEKKKKEAEDKKKADEKKKKEAEAKKKAAEKKK